MSIFINGNIISKARMWGNVVILYSHNSVPLMFSIEYYKPIVHIFYIYII